MTLNIAALISIVVVSIFIPLGFIVGLVIKNVEQRIPVLISFAAGMIIYIAMQWGIKEHGLTWLFNHADLGIFMNNHYIPYLLAVAIGGALLALLPVFLLLRTSFGKNISFVKVVAFGLGYTMTESILLTGYRSIRTIILLVKESEESLSTSAGELFMSAYERILLSVIQITIFAVLVYFIQQKMALRGGLIAVICHTLVTFLPGFCIAFSLVNYYEVYDRKVGLGLAYVILTAATVTSGVVLYNLRYELGKK